MLELDSRFKKLSSDLRFQPELDEYFSNIKTVKIVEGKRMEGSGIQDMITSGINNYNLIKNTLDILKGASNVITNVYTGEIGTKVKNVMSSTFDKNPNAREQYPNEFHMILPTKTGLSFANYAG
jgi:hypothetical protein